MQFLRYLLRVLEAGLAAGGKPVSLGVVDVVLSDDRTGALMEEMRGAGLPV